MSPPNLHIVSFDIPFPANYGGVIDVFYKLKALHEAGVRIHLHCYAYGRSPSPELEKYCETVRYYPRRTGFSVNCSLKPYIVAGRMSEELIRTLVKDDFPILFEGLHTCGIMSDKRMQGRLLIYRESNIEHQYYFHLSGAEKNPGRKLFFLFESLKLKLFQKQLSHASLMLTVSREDTAYLAAAFPEKKVVYLPSFHPNDTVNILPGSGSYALYQGKLSVPENSVAARFLVTRVWDDAMPELVIAGLDPPGWLVKLAENRPNIRFVMNPSDEEMFTLIHEAHLNIMVTFQPTGLKLKLLNALYNGRFCLVNPAMVAGTTLGGLCTLADEPSEFKENVFRLFQQDFTPGMVRQRDTVLAENYSNRINCRLLLEILNLR